MADSTATIAPTTTDPTATVTLPGGATIAPNQVNIGTRDTPNIITTSTASRSQANQNTGALNNALAMFNIGSGATTANTGTTTSTSTTTPNAGGTTTPANGTTVSPDGTTTTSNPTNDPYLTSLQNISDSSNASTKMLVQSILSAKNTQSAAVDKQYTAYKNGLQLLGIEHNEAQSTPDLLMNHINQAEDDHQAKLQTIQANTAKALATAQQAQENGDFKTLNAQMAYVKELNAEKVQTLKDYQTSITTQPKIAADVAHNVYATMQTLDPADQEAFIQQVSQQYGLPLGILVTALSDEASKQTAATTKASSAQAALDAKNVLSPSEAKTLGLPYGTTVAAAQKMGIVPTSKTAGSKSTATISKAQIAQGEQVLDASKGTDKFVDPFVYQQAYGDWTAKGGTTKAFILAYPPKDYVNPAATNLPSYLMPGKAASTKKS